MKNMMIKWTCEQRMIHHLNLIPETDEHGNELEFTKDPGLKNCRCNNNIDDVFNQVMNHLEDFIVITPVLEGEDGT